ncbi:MAG: outer membrane protein assembly factor BamA, partial [Deltaproteobacteria bacterium]
MLKVHTSILKRINNLKATPNLGFIKFIFLLSFFFSFLGFAADDLGPRKILFKIDKVEIKGLKRVEKEAILEKIGSRPGMELDNYLLQEDLKTIYSLKYFDSIEAEHKVVKGKNILLFVVKERPIITRISIDGNFDLDDDELLEQIKTKDFSILDVNQIKRDLGALQKFYEEKGYFLAAVNYQLIKVSEDNVELVFQIDEFDKIRVKRIEFLGNVAFSDNELKGIMETREESLFSFLTGSGSFKEFNFNTDVERIKFFYKTKGYLQINLGSPEITVSEDKKWVFISIKINEGPMFKINNIYFEGNDLFSESELRSKIKLKENEVYSEELLRRDIIRLTEVFQDEGYAFANVLRTLQIVPGENKVDVQFSFEKGKIAYIGKIKILGNTKTRDKVIRRELKIREGAKFSGTDLRISKENVQRLGYFDPKGIVFNTVNRADRDDVIDVEITVKERNTGQISLGAGYSTASGFFFQGSVSQNNFLGLGQSLAVSANYSKKTSSFNINFTEPYALDTKWVFGFDLFSQDDNQSRSYRYKKKGGDLRIGYPIFDYTRLYFSYLYEDLQLKEISNPTIDPDVENGLSSGLQVTLLRDARNNLFEPTKGLYISLLGEYMGVGGDKKWGKGEGDIRFYHPIVGDLIFRA